MPALGVLFGQPISARANSIIKPSDQPSPGTGTTPIADDDLWFDTAPNSVYSIELSVIASATNNVRYFFAHGGTTTYFLTQGFRSSSSHTEGTLQSGLAVGHLMFESTLSTVFGHTGAVGEHGGLHCKAVLQTGVTGGLFQLWWHLNGAGSITVHAGSYLYIRGLVS